MASEYINAAEAVRAAYRSGAPREQREALRTLYEAGRKAGAEEMRERAAVNVATLDIRDDGSDAAPGPGYARGWLSATLGAAYAIRALDAVTGEEAGMSSHICAAQVKPRPAKMYCDKCGAPMDVCGRCGRVALVARSEAMRVHSAHGMCQSIKCERCVAEEASDDE